MPPFCNTMSIQRHQSRSRSRNACHASSTAQMSNTKLLLTFVLLGLFIAAASAVDEKKSTDSKSSKPAPSASTSSLSTLSTNSAAPRDEIYIDDEGIEGSGGRGEIHDDLEKDPDYSGSGFGPDDEDSSTDHHQSIGKNSGKSQNSNDNDFITSRTSNSGTIIGSSGNAGSSGIIDSSNTGINSIGKEYLPPYPPKQQPHNNHPSTQNTNPTTTTTTTTASSSLFPPHPSNPSFPAPTPTLRKDDDYDDFDLDETIGGASGDGVHDSDDDNTGDDDIDEEIIKRVNHMHDLDKGKTFDDNIDADVDDDDDEDSDGTNIDVDSKVDDEIKHHINPYRINTLSGGAYESDTSNVAVGVTEINTNDKDKSTVVDANNDDDEDEDDAGTDVYTDVTDTTDGMHKRPGNNQGTIHELDATNNVNSLPTDTKVEHTTGNEVLIMSDDDRTTSFFAQPGILAAVIGGAVVGLLCAILVVMFIVYRMRKKDEGSYALDEPKRSPAVNSYAKNANNREFYA